MYPFLTYTDQLNIAVSFLLGDLNNIAYISDLLSEMFHYSFIQTNEYLVFQCVSTKIVFLNSFIQTNKYLVFQCVSTKTVFLNSVLKLDNSKIQV